MWARDGANAAGGMILGAFWGASVAVCVFAWIARLIERDRAAGMVGPVLDAFDASTESDRLVRALASMDSMAVRFVAISGALALLFFVLQWAVSAYRCACMK